VNVPLQMSAYVFAPDPDGQPVLAGELQLSGAGGEFRYAESWLTLPWAYPLDPENLPLTPTRFRTTTRDKVFGVFLDATPDSWGERVLLLQHTSRPGNVIEKLLRLSGAGVGGIQYSLSRTRPKVAKELPSIRLLNDLEAAAQDVDGRDVVPEATLALIAPGSSMGGARPKVTIVDEEGSAWIAKFSRANDTINNPVVEYATMSLMAKAGIEVPEIRAKSIGSHGDCFLIKRFDREQGPGIHFISAHALFNVERLRDYGDATKDPASYVALARILLKRSAKPKEDCEQLFRRMVFNIIIGNTDDHARNHAMLFDVVRGEWRLSPAYDVLPIVGSQGEQSLAVGLYGRRSSVENALSVAREFGLKPSEASAIVHQVIRVIEGYDAHFTKCGVSGSDMQILRRVLDDNLACARAQLGSEFQENSYAQ
jgi:serine/threonine-protein kinase HipA